MYTLIVFNSVSHANIIRKKLQNQLLYIAVMATPKQIGANTCSYSLRIKVKSNSNIINDENVILIKDIADRLSIKIKGIFIEETLPDKTRRYLPL